MPAVSIGEGRPRYWRGQARGCQRRSARCSRSPKNALVLAGCYAALVCDGLRLRPRSLCCGCFTTDRNVQARGRTFAVRRGRLPNCSTPAKHRRALGPARHGGGRAACPAVIAICSGWTFVPTPDLVLGQCTRGLGAGRWLARVDRRHPPSAARWLSGWRLGRGLVGCPPAAPSRASGLARDPSSALAQASRVFSAGGANPCVLSTLVVDAGIARSKFSRTSLCRRCWLGLLLPGFIAGSAGFIAGLAAASGLAVAGLGFFAL